MKIFRKDKEKEKEKEKEQTKGSVVSPRDPASLRSRANTTNPSTSPTSSLFPQGGSGSLKGKKDKDRDRERNSNGSSNGGGSIGRAATPHQQPSSPQVQEGQMQWQGQGQGVAEQGGGVGGGSGGMEAKKQHAIRIGDTRFYGRIICRAKALYDYPLDGDTLHVEDEEIKLLKFRKGDIINVYEQDSSGWWAGEFNDEKGIFPGSYMKVLPEQHTNDQSSDPPKHKLKSQHVPREELLHKISVLEAEREALWHERERDREESDQIIREIKMKADQDTNELKRMLSERDEVIQVSAKKIKAAEKEMAEVQSKLAAKEVEVLTMELEIQECKRAKPDPKKMAEERNSNYSLKAIQAEIHLKSQELNDLDQQKQEVDRTVREAKARLVALESQILRKVMTSPINDSPVGERGEDIDMLKKQLGEEVFEKRRMENEIREMKRLCVDVENLKTDKARLELELSQKLDLENKLAKIDTILQGVINKDPSTLTVASMKELLGKVRKGIAASSNSLKSGSTLGGSKEIGTTNRSSPTTILHKTVFLKKVEQE